MANPKKQIFSGPGFRSLFGSHFGSLQASILDALGLRFVYFWCSEIRFFTAEQKKTNSTGIPSKSQRKCDHRPSKNMLRRSAQNQLRFSSDFGPFWPPFWSPLGIVLEPLGTQGPPCAAKGASRAPPKIPLGPQGSTKAPPRSLWPRPGHQNDPSGIDLGGSGPPFGMFAAFQNRTCPSGCCRATCHRCRVPLKFRAIQAPSFNFPRRRCAL